MVASLTSNWVVLSVQGKYRTRAIITRGLYIFYPIFEDHFYVFKKILTLCMASIQERFVIKSGL